MHFLLYSLWNFLQNWPNIRTQNSLNKFIKIEIVSCILSDHKGITLHFNKNSDRKYTDSWETKKPTVGYNLVKKETKKEIRKFLEHWIKVKSQHTKACGYNEMFSLWVHSTMCQHEKLDRAHINNLMLYTKSLEK